MTPSMLIASKYNNSTICHAAPPLRAIVLSLQFGGLGNRRGWGGAKERGQVVGVVNTFKIDPAN